VTQFDLPRAGERLDDDPYAMWDAAYVLGSLSSNERREYESHLSGCKQCRAAVSELSGMPALLALLTREEVQALEVDQPEPPPLRPQVLDSLLDKVSWRRRRSRWVTASVLAAAAALAIGLVITLWPTAAQQGGEPPQAASPPLTMTQVQPSPINATITLTQHEWGTRIEMACTYGSWSNRDAPPQQLAMVVIGRDGQPHELATWMGVTGKTALPAASVAMPMDRINAVQIVATDTREVLLQTNL